MAEDRGVEFAAWLFAVTTAVDFLSQLLRFDRLIGFRHALREFRQLVTGQLTFARQFKSEPDHTRLFPARQLLDFFEDAACCHGAIILYGAVAFKGKCRAVVSGAAAPEV